jgi:hypothetical protein
LQKSPTKGHPRELKETKWKWRENKKELKEHKETLARQKIAIGA